MRALCALALVLLASACGSGSAPGLAASSPSPSRDVGAPVACDATPTTPRAAPGSSDLTTKPVIEIPDAAPPCTLVTADLVTGTGAAAEAGATITVKYVGVTYLDGKEFDTSWGKGDFTFLLGGGEVIAGWDQGFAGMRVGGRRELVIPPDLGYGERGAGPIPPNAPLVFVVDLVKVA